MSLVINLPPVPYVTVDKFAEMSGQKKNTVLDKCRAGVYPTLPRDSDREAVMINIAKMTKDAVSAAY